MGGIGKTKEHNMKVFTVQKSPTTPELMDVLKHQFSDEYSYTQFGLGSEKSIIVRKSPFVGVQVSVMGDEVTVTGIMPSLTGNVFLFIDFLLSGMATLLFGSSTKKLEKELALFLKEKYS